MPFCFETFSARPESSPKLPPSHSGRQVPQNNLYRYGWLFKSCRASPALGNNPEDSIHCGGHLLNSGNCFPQPISAGEEGPQALTTNIHPTLIFWFSSKIRGEVGRDKSYDIDGAKNSRHRTERGIPWAWIPRELLPVCFPKMMSHSATSEAITASGSFWMRASKVWGGPEDLPLNERMNSREKQQHGNFFDHKRVPATAQILYEGRAND